jgi:hypothetical protein
VATLLERIQSDVSEIFLGASGFTVQGDFKFDADSDEIPVSVIFDENFEPTDQFASEVAGAGPAALGSAADLCDDDGNLPQSDATIVINEVTYYVTKAMKYGDMIALQLSRDEGGGEDAG